MPPITPRADLYWRPAQLQQHCWLSKQHLGRSTERGLFHKRKRRHRAQQQFIGNACPCSLHFQLIEDPQDPQLLV